MGLRIENVKDRKTTIQTIIVEEKHTRNFNADRFKIFSLWPHFQFRRQNMKKKTHQYDKTTFEEKNSKTIGCRSLYFLYKVSLLR